MQRRIVAQEVAQKLGVLERQIDQSLVAAGALIAALPDARVRAKLSAVIGQDALHLVTQATMILSEARGKLVEAHNALAETGQQIGVGHLNITADLGNKTVPPTGMIDEPVVLHTGRAA